MIKFVDNIIFIFKFMIKTMYMSLEMAYDFNHETCFFRIFIVLYQIQ